VAGTIELDAGMDVDNPYLTIAGQTAPGGGITLKNGPNNKRSPFTIYAHDVIIRYIRVRPGPSSIPSASLDAIQVVGGYNVIIDHCSLSWGVDETFSTYFDPHDVTLQWSIVSEPLHCSLHEKGCHGYALLVASEGAYNISVHHNLLAHGQARFPRIKTTGLVDVVNNVVYNAVESSRITDDYGTVVPVNYVGNYVKAGPNSDADAYFVKMAQVGPGFSVFVQGNISPHRPRDDMDESLSVSPEDRPWIVSTRHSAPPVTTVSALDAYDRVLEGAGATIGRDDRGNSIWRRDAVDERVVREVRAGTGKIIDDPAEVGGWPPLLGGTPPADTDGDGMPDLWETMYGLNPASFSDGPADADGDGYTNLEEYLNGTNPTDPRYRIVLPLVLRR
jgi:hypothetical protein